MEQISLNIVKRLPYSPEGFILHSGVREDFERCRKLISANKSAFVFYFGLPEYGKSHLAIKLEALLSEDGIPVLAASGEEFENLLNADRISLSDGAVIVVDDAHLVLSKFNAGDSGKFVKFAEALRSRNISLVLMSAVAFSEFRFDEHIASRLKAGSGFHIEAPSQEELPLLIKQMSLQRGQKLTPRKIEYIATRVSRDPASVARFLAERLE